MAYGISILNSSGYTQIDETYRNLQLIAQGTATTGSTVYFSGGDTLPLIAIGVTGAGCYCTLNSLTTNSFVVTARSPSTSFTYPYRVYTTVASPPSGTFGLRVYNSSGQVTFDSTYPLLVARYVQSIDIPTNFTVSSLTAKKSFSITHNLGGSPYVILNGTSPMTRYIQSGHTYSAVNAACLSNSSSTTVDIIEYEVNRSDQTSELGNNINTTVVGGYTVGIL